MNEYRTPEQFTEIVENCLNGNWRDAAKNCVNYGFYANDLCKANIAAEENGEINFGEINFTDLYDLAELSKMAEKLRGIPTADWDN